MESRFQVRGASQNYRTKTISAQFPYKIILVVITVLSVCGDTELEAQDSSGTEPLIIFTASSAAGAIEDIGESATTTLGTKPKIVIGPSGTLARQVTAGAPADIFISANQEWMDYLKNNDSLSEEPVPLIGNRLVFAVPKNHPLTENVPGTLADMLAGEGRIALADPKIAPLGRYSINHLTSLNLWGPVSGKAVYSPSARQTLRLIEKAGLPGFIYASHAARSADVVALLTLESDESGTILYEVAITKHSRNPDIAATFVSYLRSGDVAKIWQAHGFSLLETSGFNTIGD